MSSSGELVNLVTEKGQKIQGSWLKCWPIDTSQTQEIVIQTDGSAVLAMRLLYDK